MKHRKLRKRIVTLLLICGILFTVSTVMPENMQVQAAQVSANLQEQIKNSTYNYDYYCGANEDVAVALNYNEEKMYEHWLNYGIAEGRSASLVYNAKYYLEINPKVAAEIGNDYTAAYEHFITEGLLEGLESSPVFSVTYYLQANADVAQAFQNDYVEAASHFNESAINEGRSGSGNFDYTVYADCNTDVAKLYGDNRLGYYIHYINHGRAEGRTGGLATGNIPEIPEEDNRRNIADRIFMASYYLERYPELANSVGTDEALLFKHWITEGITNGMTASPVIVPEEYLEINTDVAATFGNDAAAAIEHFLENGIYEGRSGSYEFDFTVYKYCNTDVAEVFGEDIVGYYYHYVNFGIAEGRTARVDDGKDTEDTPEEGSVISPEGQRFEFLFNEAGQMERQVCKDETGKVLCETTIHHSTSGKLWYGNIVDDSGNKLGIVNWYYYETGELSYVKVVNNGNAILYFADPSTMLQENEYRFITLLPGHRMEENLFYHKVANTLDYRELIIYDEADTEIYEEMDYYEFDDENGEFLSHFISVSENGREVWWCNYDEQGNRLDSAEMEYYDNGEDKKYTGYDEKGRISNIIEYDENGEWYHLIYKYDEDGHITQETRETSENRKLKTSITYDGDGNCIKCFMREYHENGKEKVTIYYLDEAMTRVDERLENHENGSAYRTIQYNYDITDKLTGYTVYEFADRADRGIYNRYVYKYFTSGILYFKQEYSENQKPLLSILWNGLGTLIYSVKYEYYDNGNMKSRMEYSDAEMTDLLNRKEYDEEGNLILSEDY